MRKLWYWITMPFIRHYRHTVGECLVCGRYLGIMSARYRYCSCECAAYDGALRDPSKSWVLFGMVMKEPKRHHEHDMKCGED